MKKQIKKFIFGFCALALVGVTSCETTDLDINDNPGSLTSESADPNFILNGLQFSTGIQNVSLSGITSGVVRQINQFGTYASSAGPETMNGPWSNAYSLTSNLNLLKELSAEKNLPVHVGIGQVLEVMAYINLVDYMGTAVYSEAVNPAFTQPNLDEGIDIYKAMLAQLDEALVNLNGQGSITHEDIYYEELSSWKKLANTLKIKIYVQSRLAGDDWDGDGTSNKSAIEAVVTGGSFISANADDFQVYFGTKETNPDTRHYGFTTNYITAADDYMSNDFMNRLINGKSMEDPRLPYYIYRQTLEDPLTLDPGGDLLPCNGNADYQYCYLGSGYWGRDHADDEGIPNDGVYRSTWGVYPAGGAFDEGNGGSTLESINLGGAGIQPIILASFTHFWLAEAALTMGVNADARAMLKAGMELSFSKVGDFAGKAIDEADVTAYVDEVLANYDAAATNDDKLAIVMEEFYIASFGNSVEPYNNYRRTGYPVLGESVITNTDFPRSFFIPSSEINSNDNPDLEQKKLGDRVFWDTNPEDFID